MARCDECIHHEPCSTFNLVRTKVCGDNADKMCRMFEKAATDKNDGHKSPCKVCERITEANKDIFWVFARTHQPQDQEEFHRVPVRFCPACGREFADEAQENQ